MSRRWTTVWMLQCGWLLLCASPAWAQPAAAGGGAAAPPEAVAAAPLTPAEEAQRLYKEGVGHYKAGRFAEAGERFQAAYNLDPSPILLYNLGRSAEESGELEAAVRHYKAYLVRFPNADDRAGVEGRILTLESQIAEAARGALVLRELPPGASVFIDEQPAEAEDGKWPLDPGTYAVRVITPDGDLWNSSATIQKGKPTELTFVAPASTPPSEGGISTQAIIGWSSVGLGAVALGASGFFFAQAHAAAEDYDAARKDQRRGEAERGRAAAAASDDFDSNSLLFYVSGSIGLAAVATGVTLLVLDDGPEGGASAALVPLPGGLGLSGTF